MYVTKEIFGYFFHRFKRVIIIPAIANFWNINDDFAHEKWSNLQELELEESKDCQKVFGQFLRFFYCGKISFTSDTALPLLVLAAKYKVEALRSACDAFIANMIEDGDLKSAIKWLKYATRYHLNVSQLHSINQIPKVNYCNGITYVIWYDKLYFKGPLNKVCRWCHIGQHWRADWFSRMGSSSNRMCGGHFGVILSSCSRRVLHVRVSTTLGYVQKEKCDGWWNSRRS